MMKRIVFVIMFISCGSKDRKTREMAKLYLDEMLMDADSYKAIGFGGLDSVKSTVDDVFFYTFSEYL